MLDKSNYNCFSILDSANTQWQLKLKEGLYISWKTQTSTSRSNMLGKHYVFNIIITIIIIIIIYYYYYYLS